MKEKEPVFPLKRPGPPRSKPRAEEKDGDLKVAVTKEQGASGFQVMGRLSHYDERGKARMVDVTAKSVTHRTAMAHAFVKMSPRVLAALRKLQNPKGNPLEVARIAGISAAKRTSEWIPLCHPLPLTHIDVHPRVCKNGVEIRTQVTAAAQTGVEMEALVAAAAAALTVYDMCKALDKGIEIGDLFLLKKTGGKSGDFFREVGRRGSSHEGKESRRSAKRL